MPYLAPTQYEDRRAQMANTEAQQQSMQDAQMRNQLLSRQENRLQASDDFESNIQKHNFIAGVSRAVMSRLEGSGLQEGSPEYQQLFDQTMNAYKPQVAKVLNKPEIMNTPNDINAVKALASWDQEKGDLKNHLQIIYDRQGNAYYANTAEGGEAQPITYGGQAIQGAQYSPEGVAMRERAKQGEIGVDVTDEEGREYRAPQREVNPAFNNNNPGNLRPVGSAQGFQQFNSPEDGLKAIDDNLLAYSRKHGINTLEGVISRWSPPSENDTSRLVATAAKRLGINPAQPIDLENPVVRQAVSTVIALQENPVFSQKSPVKSQSTKEKAQIESNIKINEDLAKQQNQQKLVATDPVKLKAKSDVDAVIDEMSGLYDKLDKTGDITNPDKSESANLKAYLKGTGAGQAIGKMIGSKDQSTRNAILAKMPLLTQSIMKATGMTGGQLNSVPELENFMRAVTNPQMDIKSIKNQFKTLKKLFGTSAGVSEQQQPDNDIEDLLKMYGGE
jgi:hypothetical protein